MEELQSFVVPARQFQDLGEYERLEHGSEPHAISFQPGGGKISQRCQQPRIKKMQLIDS
jgi:hypothetical protein